MVFGVNEEVGLNKDPPEVTVTGCWATGPKENVVVVAGVPKAGLAC